MNTFAFEFYHDCEMSELQEIRTKIYTFRGKQVMLDADLAEMYEVDTAQLKRAVRRNIERFPEDFAFTLNNSELNLLKNSMRCQNGTSKRGGTTYLPIAFTEQGVAMLSGVLRSPTAIQVNIRIMRAFVAIRQHIGASHCENCHIENKVDRLAAYIEEILADQNDINEENRCQIELINQAIASLHTDNHLNKKPRTIIKGFTND